MQDKGPSWIRGVNIGGWLLLERFITPYMFALTNCHTQGEFCWYPGQISAPPISSHEHSYCDISCGFLDEFPTNEGELISSFDSKIVAQAYLAHHWKNFVVKQDIHQLHIAGVTHVRIPIPHWIMGDILEDEPWVDGQWDHLIQLVGWCREYGIQVWPDIRTAPGAQDGVATDGHLVDDWTTCHQWSDSEENRKRSMKAVEDIAKAVRNDNLHDVITGIGVLNAHSSDCDVQKVKDFYDEALITVRGILGEDTSVFIGDMFDSSAWNDGWWIDEGDYSNTFLDSHYFHAFDANVRSLTPKQQIALVCERDAKATEACCYEDYPLNQKPSMGISRLVGEWSAAFDIEPNYKVEDIMKGIRQNKGEAPELDRAISRERREFLGHFVEAQMVAYEAVNSSQPTQVSHGWFYSTLKTEGGAFAEWDFIRGHKNGWIPPFPARNETSESHFGTCREIIAKTEGDDSIVKPFPDPSSGEELWSVSAIDDDFVVSEAENLNDNGNREPIPTEEAKNEETKNEVNEKEELQEDKEAAEDNEHPESDDASSNAEHEEPRNSNARSGLPSFFPVVFIGFFGYGVWQVFFKEENVRNRRQYTRLDAPTQLSV